MQGKCESVGMAGGCGPVAGSPMQLYKVELERTQLQQQLDAANKRQLEETEALQNSHM